MKKMMFLAVMMVMTISANAARPLDACTARMSYNAAKNEALFLSDKMAYELDLTAAQYDAVYEINLDYLMSVNGHADVFGIWWDRRNADLRFVLTPWQYDRYAALNYFYRPISWHNGAWTFHVYSRYDRGKFFMHHPTVFVSYRGGHNRVHGSHYAHMHKPAPAPAKVHHGGPMPDKGPKAMHDNGHRSPSNVHRSTGAPNRAIAQKATVSNDRPHSTRGGSGHFGGRR